MPAARTSETERTPPPRSRRHPLLGAALLIVLVIAALVLPPLINIGRYQRQIAASLTAALGHSVEISGITLQLLPRPGVHIADFAVDSAPGFSAEPILQCSSVAAAFRIASLWRGRLEIARISLDEPSLNLERAPDGQWNFASVLLRAAHAQQAPTGHAAVRGQNRFPYIEAGNARINLKRGNEKLPLSFLNADVSIWLENPNEWQLRFAAQPVRTDMNLSSADTGTVRISGSVHRASATNQLPLDLEAEWRGAPLGQLTRMITTHDLGWRGDTRFTAHILGVPNALALDLSAAVADFHRETFEPAHPLNLRLVCAATYRHALGSLDGIRCLSRVGDGNLELRGSVQQPQAETPLPDLRLTLTRVPAEGMLELLRHTRGRLSNDITVAGAIDGEFRYARQPLLGPPHLPPGLHTVASGSLLATGLLLESDGVEQSLPNLRFVVQSGPSAPPGRASGATQPVALVLEPVQIDLGGAAPLRAAARLTRHGYQLHYSGNARLRQLLPLTRAFSLAPAAFQSLQGTGTANCNLTLQGDWLLPPLDPLAAGQPVPLSAVNGTVTLENADVQPAYLAEPAHITSATAAISPDEIRWSGIIANLGVTRFAGGLRIPLPCLAGCERRFDLSAATVNFAALASSLQGQDEGVVQDLINRVRSRSQDWPALEGVIHIAHLDIGRVDIAAASAEVGLRDGNLAVRSLDGRVFGGALHATGAVELAGSPRYDTEVQLRHVDVPSLAQSLHERWGPGQIDLFADLTLRGMSAADLAGSAVGAVQWNWTAGAMPELTATALRRFERWSGSGTVKRGALSIGKSEVTAGSAILPVMGSIAADRSLDLKTGDTSIGGTLAAPVARQP